MKKIFNKAFNEIKQNLDIYIIILTAIVVGILGLLQVVSFELVSAAILATLGLIATSLLASRKAVDDTQKITAQVAVNLENLRNTLISKPKVSDVFFNGYPDLSTEIKSARNIKSLSIALTSHVHYLRDFSSVLMRGGSIQILVCNKSDSLLEMLAFRSSGLRDPEKYKRSIASNLDRAQTLSRYTEDGSKLEIREIPYIPTFGMLIIEDERGEIKIYTLLTAFRTGGSQNPGFVITKKDDYWFAYFTEQFEQMWNASEVVTTLST